LRNALLLQPSNPRDFDWSPRTVPDDFLLERRQALPCFVAAVEAVQLPPGTGDWEKALRLASYLVEKAQDRGPIRADLQTTLRRIREGYGYCADFVKVFTGLAHAAGIFCRQWAFSFDGFGGHGHVIVEIFDPVRGKWLFLDVHNNFHVVDAKANEPLGALEFRDYLLGLRGEAKMVPNGPGRPGYIHPEKALDYYRRGLDQWYLMWGNSVFTYDAQPVVRVASRLSGGLGQFAATALKVHPRIRILPTSSNAVAVAQLRVLGTRLRWTLGSLGGLCLLLAGQILAAGVDGKGAALP
jgi:hypothetical protein